MKIQNKLTFIIALAAIIFAVLACGNSDKKESTSTTTKSGSTDSRSSTENNPNASSGAGGDLSTPTRSHAAMYQAMKTGDISAYKKTLSKCLLDKSADYAKQQNISLDEYVKKSLELVPATSIKTPEVRSEKISGDTATLEEKDFRAGEGWNEVPYIKEDGGWKWNALCNF